MLLVIVTKRKDQNENLWKCEKPTAYRDADIVCALKCENAS